MGPLAFLFLAMAAAGAPTVSPAEIRALGQSLAHAVCPPDAASKVESLRRSPYDAETVERLETVSCAAGEAQALRSPLVTDPNGLVLHVYVRRSTQRLPDFLQIGAPAQPAIERLGEPFDRHDGSVVFALDDATSTLEISHADGKIVRLAWMFYAG